MLYAYAVEGGRITLMERGADLRGAMWIDMVQPGDVEVAALTALGVEVPSLADMEEIEISNRLFRENGMDYMTAVLPGERGDGSRAAMPVSFILSPERLVTVRHHSPRPFLTFPDRGERSTLGCSTSDRLFMGLVEEIVARQADILEASGRVLDEAAQAVFERRTGATGPMARAGAERLQAVLRQVGREAELLARVRLGLLTIERMLAFYIAIIGERKESGRLRPAIKGQLRDVQALQVHADFLSSRVSLTVDTTLGMINLEQNSTVRILSVLTALFLPPTLIASMYGMNFVNMPELEKPWGYPMALGLMVGTSAATWLLLRWKNWL
ncbi:magnesium transporter CorA family protein [Paracoccus marinaquae]|uniref:Magnesium transporter CorA family protein n=1 Tax=Paracoccus marinaquae TaxID=2841926 RepID=A0ABS6AHQ9_9RHOB|nr:magnesium transporter CorA family protein [Paracoccus marinaquae]MBU3030136.1 magnesium transporter CorA family protein [Paracoccus marinaquae]